MAINKKSSSYIATQGQAKQALDNVQKNFQDVLNSIGNITESQLNEIALTVLNTSNRYAPLDEGELIDSSYIASENDGSKVTVEMGYKDPKSVYTHEIGPYKSPTTPGTNYKYLERAVTETESDIPRILADAIKNQLGI